MKGIVQLIMGVLFFVWMTGAMIIATIIDIKAKKECIDNQGFFNGFFFCEYDWQRSRSDPSWDMIRQLDWPIRLFTGSDEPVSEVGTSSIDATAEYLGAADAAAEAAAATEAAADATAAAADAAAPAADTYVDATTAAADAAAPEVDYQSNDTPSISSNENKLIECKAISETISAIAILRDMDIPIATLKQSFAKEIQDTEKLSAVFILVDYVYSTNTSVEDITNQALGKCVEGSVFK